MGCWRVLKERSLMMSSVKESTVKQPPPSGWNEGPCSNNPKWALLTQKSPKSSLTSLICAPGALFNWSKQRFPKTSENRDICTSGLELCKQSVLFQFSYMSFSTSNAVSTLHNLSLKRETIFTIFPRPQDKILSFKKWYKLTLFILFFFFSKHTSSLRIISFWIIKKVVYFYQTFSNMKSFLCKVRVWVHDFSASAQPEPFTLRLSMLLPS